MQSGWVGSLGSVKVHNKGVYTGCGIMSILEEQET